MTHLASPLDRTHVRVTGVGGRALVFGHGFGTDQRAWRFVAPAFEPSRQTVLFDHVGFGGSDRAAYSDTRHASLDGYAQDLLDVLDALGLQQVDYVGQSAGGLIGLLASLQAPTRFRRLVLIGTSPRFINEPPDYVGGFERAEIEGILDLMERDQIAWSETLAPLAIGEGNPGGLVAEFGSCLREIDPLVARRFGRMVFNVDVRDRLAAVTTPALLVQCSHDSIVPMDVARYLHAHLRGSRLHEINGHGHCPHLTHPRQTIDAITAHLDAAAV